MRIFMRKINISNELKRDAEVAYGTTFRREAPSYRTASGCEVTNVRRLKATMATSEAALAAAYGDGLADALVNGDPEVDMQLAGLSLEGLKRVYVTPGQKVAYGATLSEHVYLPDGTEKEVRPETATAANIALEGVPVRWTGKLIPKEKAMRMFMFKKSYQVQHVNGLTYDFLYEMAKKLSDAKAMMLVGAGPKGADPLVMSGGGTPYRAFLEGRVEGDKYALILRLTNLELKEIPVK
jgi:hypothetical protein